MDFFPTFCREKGIKSAVRDCIFPIGLKKYTLNKQKLTKFNNEADFMLEVSHCIYLGLIMCEYLIN